MDAVQAALGVALIVIVFADLLQTTLMVSGHGFLSGRLSMLVWRGLLLIHRSRPSHRLLRAGGPLIILLFYLLWFLLLWVGWSLVFASGDPSVVQSVTKKPPDVSDLLYFTGFTIITLGVGDYVPQGDLWQILTVIASVSGFFLVTMVITYVLPVISAVVKQRQLASGINGIGGSTQGLLERAWSGRDFSELNLQLVLLTQQIQEMEKQHLAYPVLHYFHSTSRSSASAPAVAALDDFVSVLLLVVPEEERPTAAVLAPLRAALDELLATLSTAFISPSGEAPPPPVLPERLAGEAPDISHRFEQISERRRLLAGWVADLGLPWQPRN